MKKDYSQITNLSLHHKQNMDAAKIIYQLRCLGKSQAQLARELGVSSGVINNVIHDRITAYAIATHIAKLLGSNAIDLWPERYVFKPRGRKQNSGNNKCLMCDTNGGVS